MSRQDVYFQFPLCALAHASTFRERLIDIIAYSMVKAGAVFWDQLSPEERRDFHSRRPKVFTPDDYKPENPQHWWAMLAMERMQFDFPSIREMLNSHDRIGDHVADFENDFGRNPLVRIRKDILLDVFSPDSGLSYTDFAVYAAIVSAIGSEPYARITRRTILCRMGGYKSVAARRALLSRRSDGREWKELTEKQLRAVLDRLHRRKLFVKLNPSRTQAFYSIRMSADELEAALAARVPRAEAFRQETAARNARLQERSKAGKSDQMAGERTGR